MKVAYVTTYAASDVSNWSGLGHFIEKSLLEQSIDIERIGPLSEYPDPIIKTKQLYYAYFTRKKYHRNRDPRLLSSYADQVTRQLSGIRADVVFSPGTIPICYLKHHKPVVFWTDATYAGMVNFYPGFTDLCKESVMNGNRMEQAALSNCRLAIYSSDWAARTAKDNYQVDESKIKVVPFGANIECRRDLEDIRRIVSGRSMDVCRLLFVGVDWLRKGGDLAVDLAAALNHRGVKTELSIVGCIPPGVTPKFVTVQGFASKTTTRGRLTIDDSFGRTHYLILPSRADCAPVVIAEANSFGVPVVTSNVGGIPDIVSNGINGAAFPITSFVSQACDFILDSFPDTAAYRQLAESSFGQYENKLNWQVAGKRVKQLLEEVCRQ